MINAIIVIQHESVYDACLYFYHVIELVDLISCLHFFCDRPKWISIYGERFHNQGFVLIGFQDDDLPSFGKT